MYRTVVQCACGSEREVSAECPETDSSFRCDCGANYVLTVTRLEQDETFVD